MKISVIIPVYNGEKYLEEAVVSVISQPYKNIDIVIVDDGSTDGTPGVCDKLAERYAQVSCIHKENGGVSSARNTGIEFVLSRSTEKEFIAFLDADDKWNGGIVTDHLIEEHHSDDIIVFGQIQTNITADRFGSPKRYTDKVYTECQKLIWHFAESFCCKFFSSELFRKYEIRFDEKLKHNEDRIMQFQCIIFSEKISTVSGILFIRRNHPLSVSHTSYRLAPKELYAPMIEGWMRCDDFIEEHGKAYGISTSQGHAMAAVYLMDLAAYSCRKSVKDGKNAINSLRSFPVYERLKSVRPNDVSPAQYKNKCLLFDHPSIFIVKHRINGIFFNMQKRISSLPFVYRINEHRKYPLTAIQN